MARVAELVAVEMISKGRRLSLTEEIVGVAPEELARAMARKLSTPHGVVTLIHSTGRLVVEGGSVPRGEVQAPDPVSIAVARRGLSGEVNGRELSLVRPRFGWRLRNRSVFLESGAIRWRSVMRSYRTFEIRTCDTDEVILTSRKRDLRVPASLSPEELVMALLFSHCGIVEASSLLNVVTF